MYNEELTLAINYGSMTTSRSQAIGVCSRTVLRVANNIRYKENQDSGLINWYMYRDILLHLRWAYLVMLYRERYM
jgi:hypothetical protein